jgi:capsular polysaccharide biosynthesis protein
LFYSYPHEVSFCHYLCETVPKLYNYLNYYKNYKLLIPEHRYNNLCKNVLNLLDINESQITILKDRCIYIINHYITTNIYHSIPSNLTYDHISIYKKIREKLNILPNNLEPLRKVYLKRDGIPNYLYGNSETGLLRQIINENELIEELIKEGFEIITLGSKNIKEKSFLLNNIKILITPLGANCMNLIFCNNPHNIIYLSNNKNFGNEQYSYLSEQLNDCKINSIILKYEGFRTDPLNQWNNSFNVDIKDIKDIINKIL